MNDTVFTDAQRGLLDEHQLGVIAIMTPDGRLHQSVVRYVMDRDDVCVSTESGRAKVRYADAGGEIRFTVMAPDLPNPSVTVIGRGDVQRSEIAEITARVMSQMGMDDAVSDDDLAAVGRVILRIRPERVRSAWI